MSRLQQRLLQARCVPSPCHLSCPPFSDPAGARSTRSFPVLVSCVFRDGRSFPLSCVMLPLPLPLYRPELPPQARPPGGMSTIPHWFLPYGSRLSPRPVRNLSRSSSVNPRVPDLRLNSTARSLGFLHPRRTSHPNPRPCATSVRPHRATADTRTSTAERGATSLELTLPVWAGPEGPRGRGETSRMSCATRYVVCCCVCTLRRR